MYQLNVLFLTIVLFHVQSMVESKLLQVQVIFRHGDRAPLAVFPTDPIKADHWKGLGQLTEEGIREHFYFGQWLRKRYSDFLGDNFNTSLIYVRSSDIDRTLMSAESNLAGIFFEHKKLIIPGLQWRPVPVHTVSKTTDFLILGQDDCPVYPVLLEKVLKQPHFAHKLAPYQDFVKKMAKLTGWTNLNIRNMWRLYDTVKCEKSHNLTIATWITDDVWKKLIDINNIIWDAMFWDDLARMAGGVMLKQVVTHMWNASRNPGFSPVRLYMYSGHDTDVAPLMKLLTQKPHFQPPYASAVILELHRDNVSHHDFVKVFFKNTTLPPQQPLAPIRVLGCNPGKPCPLESFMAAVDPYGLTKTQYEELCAIHSARFLMMGIQIVLGVVACVLVLGILLAAVCRSCRSHPSDKYSRLNQHTNIN